MDIQQLFVKLRKRFAGQYVGQFRSVFKGSGVEIADSRKYVSGDAQKFINRKQSAKHNDLYVSILEQDSDVHVDVLCDVNYNRGGTVAQKNSTLIMEYLSDLVVFARTQGLHLNVYYPQGDSLGLCEIRRGQDWYSVQQSLEQSLAAQKPVYCSSISLFLDTMMQCKKKRVLMIVSDFLDVSGTDQRRLKILSKEHHILLIRIPVSSWEGVNYLGTPFKKYTDIGHLFVSL